MSLLYFHWPFGLRHCCRYFSAPCFLASREKSNFYTKVIAAELKNYKETRQIQHLEAIYISGLVANAEADQYLLDIAGILDIQYQLVPAVEVSVEVHPAIMTKEYLQRWRTSGVNRVNIGFCTVSDSILSLLHGQQTVRDNYCALEQAAGIYDNIAIELTIGLPGMSDVEWFIHMEKLIEYPIKQITFSAAQKGEYGAVAQGLGIEDDYGTEKEESSWVLLYTQTKEFFESHGFMQYECFSFARPGYQSRYMTALWKGETYRGFGLGARSYDGQVKTENMETIGAYTTAVRTGIAPVAQTFFLTPAEQVKERVIMGLGMVEGVRYVDIMICFDKQRQQRAIEALRFLQKQKLLTHDRGRVRLTFAGMMVKRAIIRFLGL